MRNLLQLCSTLRLNDPIFNQMFYPMRNPMLEGTSISVIKPFNIGSTYYISITSSMVPSVSHRDRVGLGLESKHTAFQLSYFHLSLLHFNLIISEMILGKEKVNLKTVFQQISYGRIN